MNAHQREALLKLSNVLQWNLYKADTIAAKKVSALYRCPLYRDFSKVV